jgi:hypothetical protein
MGAQFVYRYRLFNKSVTFPQTVAKVAALLLLSSSLIGCGDCSFETIDSSENNEWTADLEYRVCGSYSGFAVSIYPTSKGHPGYGEGSKEPFQAAIRSSEPYSFQEPPVSIKWTSDRNLLIEHETRMSVEDSISKLKIFKADSQYQDVSISYNPEPVVWERK